MRTNRILKRPWSKPKEEHSGTITNKMSTRKRSNDLYHTWRWTKESKAYRDVHPLCAECERAGKIAASEVVDHIIPSEVCEDFWDQENWQPLCRECNRHKGRTHDKKVIKRMKKLND